MTATTKKDQKAEPTKAEQRHAELAEAEQKYALATERLRRAEDEAASTAARLRAGDLDLQPEDVRAATEAVTHWQTMAEALGQQVKTAQRRLLPLHHDLAEAVAETIGTGIHGVPAEALDSVPEYDGAASPRLVVVQNGMHTPTGGGSLAGNVTVALVAADYVQPIDPSGLMRLLASRDAGTNLDTRTMSGRRRLTFDVTAFPAVPATNEPSDYHVVGFANGLAANLVHNSYSGTFQGQTISATGGGLVTSTKVDQGERTTKVDVALTVAPVRDSAGETWWSDAEVVEQVQRHLVAVNGRVANALGRIESVTLTSAEPRRGINGRNVYVVHADLVIRSRVV